MNKFKYTLLRCFQLLFIFTLSGTIYYIMEVIFKGSSRGSHWSMFVLSGIASVVFIDGLNNVFTYEMDWLLQSAISSIMITIWEYFTGCIFNQNYSIWDYRNLPFNFQGQICLYFTLLWFVLAFIYIPILDYIEWKWFKYKSATPPYYKIFNHVVLRFGKEKESNG